MVVCVTFDYCAVVNNNILFFSATCTNVCTSIDIYLLNIIH